MQNSCPKYITKVILSRVSNGTNNQTRFDANITPKTTIRHPVAGTAIPFTSLPPPDMIFISQNGQTIPIAAENGKPDTATNCFYMKSKDRHIKIAVSDKFWVKGEGSGNFIMTEYGELMSTLNLRSFLLQVKHPSLLRIHKSYVVNTCKLTSFDSRAEYINYKGQEKVLAIGATSRDEFKNQMTMLLAD